MLGYPQLRKADIPTDERDMFERVGESGLQLTLAGGFHPKADELGRIYSSDTAVIRHAQEWLTERADLRARHEWRLERLEWAILIFVILGVVADFVLAFHGFNSK